MTRGAGTASVAGGLSTPMPAAPPAVTDIQLLAIGVDPNIKPPSGSDVALTTRGAGAAGVADDLPDEPPNEYIVAELK